MQNIYEVRDNIGPIDHNAACGEAKDIVRCYHPHLVPRFAHLRWQTCAIMLVWILQLAERPHAGWQRNRETCKIRYLLVRT